MVRPSSRGGVPVFRRQPRSPSALRIRPEARQRVPRASCGILLLAAVNQPVEKRARGDDYGLRAHGAAVPQLPPKLRGAKQWLADRLVSR